MTNVEGFQGFGSRDSKPEADRSTRVPAPAFGSGPRFRRFTHTPRVASTESPWGLHGGSPAPPAGPPQGMPLACINRPCHWAPCLAPACSGHAALRLRAADAERWTSLNARDHHKVMSVSHARAALLLVGPKGAGKSTVGTLLASELGIYFLRVEPLFLEVRASLGSAHPDYERQGFLSVLSGVADTLATHATVCLESTGASTLFPWFLSELERLAHVVLIRVSAPPQLCSARVQSRDKSVHIPVSDDQVVRINTLAFAVSLPWSLEIDNGGPFDGPGIVTAVRQLLSAFSSPRGV